MFEFRNVMDVLVGFVSFFHFFFQDKFIQLAIFFEGHVSYQVSSCRLLVSCET